MLGFANAVGAEKVPIGAVYIYRVNFFAGCGLAAAVYWVLCWIWPVPGVGKAWCERGEQVDSELRIVDGDGRAMGFEDERDSAGTSGDDGEEKETAYRDRPDSARGREGYGLSAG